MRDESLEETKYYFFNYQRIEINSTISRISADVVKNEHPFFVIAEMKKYLIKKQFKINVTLLNWQEITKEEFELWEKYNNE